MTELRSSLHGLWLPLITPFRDGALDEASLRELVRHYLSLPIRGLILAATTGEGLTLDPHETERLVFAGSRRSPKAQQSTDLPRACRQQHSRSAGDARENGGLANRWLPIERRRYHADLVNAR